MSNEITISLTDKQHERLIGIKLRHYPDSDLPTVAKKLFQAGLVSMETDKAGMLNALVEVVWDRFIELNEIENNSPSHRMDRLVDRLNSTLHNVVTVLIDLDEVISKLIPDEIAIKRPVVQPLARAGIGQAISQSSHYPSASSINADSWDPGKRPPKPSKKLRSLDFIKITEPKKKPEEIQEPIEPNKQDMDLEYT